jgi:thiol-disulfide isomerase/thioredoxin
MAVESMETHIATRPDGRVTDLEGNVHQIKDLVAERASVIAFVCNHCPYVRWIESELGNIARAFPEVAVIAITSNDVDTYPDDDVPGMREQIARADWSFPYVIDRDQSVARTFGAVCTPDFFVFSPDGALVYRGAMDDSRPSHEAPANGYYLRAALSGSPERGRPSLGCGIKWLG